MRKKNYLRALTIAGFDGSGGAGIQGDLKAFSALGCYGMTVLTALPVQNTTGVKSVYAIPEQCVAEQLIAILDDIGVDVVKMGMLHRREVIDCLADVLDARAPMKIVLDPVMVAKSGCLLLAEDAIDSLQHRLFPLATLITPNLAEASALLQREIRYKEQMEGAARELIKRGSEAVLLKGGHLEDGSCDDCLLLRDEEHPHWFCSPRFNTINTHGTGCTLSSAIAAFLAHGHSIVESVKLAKAYISQCIDAGSQYEVGHGHGPVHHFFSFWGETQMP